MRTLFVFFIMCIVSASVSFAEEATRVATITVGASGTAGVKHTSKDGDAYYKTDTGTRGGLDVSAQGFFNDYVGFGVDFQMNNGTDHQSYDDDGHNVTGDENFLTTSLAFLLLFRYPLTPNVDIYGGGGIALVRAEYDISDVYIDGVSQQKDGEIWYYASDATAAAVMKIGLNIYVAEHVVIGGMLKHVAASVELDDEKYDVGGLSIGAYAGFAF